MRYKTITSYPNYEVSDNGYVRNKIKQGYCFPYKSKAESVLILTYNKGLCVGFVLTALVDTIFSIIKY